MFFLVLVSCNNKKPPHFYKTSQGILKTGLYEINESETNSCKKHDVEKGKEKKVCIDSPLVIGVDHIEKVETVSVEYEGISEKERQLRVKFNKIGKKKFEEFTNKNRGRRIAFVINDRIVSMPFIQEKISSGIMIAVEKYSKTKLSIFELREIVEYELSNRN